MNLAVLYRFFKFTPISLRSPTLHTSQIINRKTLYNYKHKYFINQI